MHERTVYHCDVKAGNIFLDQRGEAYLGDYGSAVLTANQIPHECSIATHWPADLEYTRTPMTAALDFFLLTVTLLDLVEAITLEPGKGAPFTRAQIQEKVRSLEEGQFKSFLVQLNNYGV